MTHSKEQEDERQGICTMCVNVSCVCVLWVACGLKIETISHRKVAVFNQTVKTVCNNILHHFSSKALECLDCLLNPNVHVPLNKY